MPAPADLPGSHCTGRPTTMDFTNSAFTVKFFAYYFEKLSGLVELMDASFNKHEATTANGKQLRDQLRFRHRQLSLSVNAVSKEVHDMPKTTKLTPTQQYDFGAILVDSIKHYSWMVTLVCEGCCPIDRRIWAGPPSMSLFISSFPLMTENNKHHLKQLSQFRHSMVHAANTYADHQGELCHSTITSHKQCGTCKVYVTLLQGCQLQHETINWNSSRSTKFLGKQVDSPTALEMSDVLDQEFYQHSAIEHFLWSSPFTYQMLFENDSCLQSGSQLVSSIFRNKFPERKLKDSTLPLPSRVNKAVMTDRKVYEK